MTRYAVIAVATAISICTAAFTAHAHHSYGLFFDLCTSVTVEGRVDAIQWKNPHVSLHLITDDGTAYRAEWTSVDGLLRTGVKAESVKVGDRVAVTGSPLKDLAQIDPAFRAPFRDPAAPKVVSAVTQVRRASDSWRWARDGGTPPPECAARK